MLDEAKRQVPAIFAERGEHRPLMIIEAPGIGVFILPLDFGDTGDQKRRMMAAVRDFLQSMNAQRYIMIFEAWYTQTNVPPNADGSLKDGELMPSERPDRMECILLFGEDKSGNSVGGMWQISRAGKKASLGEFDTQIDTMMPMNAFTGILGERTRH